MSLLQNQGEIQKGLRPIYSQINFTLVAIKFLLLNYSPSLSRLQGEFVINLFPSQSRIIFGIEAIKLCTLCEMK